MAINKRRNDFLGKRFTRLTVLKYVKSDDDHSYWLCLCDCGNKRIVIKQALLNGGTKSCGCLRKDRFLKSSTKHNLSNDKIYKVWHSMMQRCYNKKCKAFPRYGGRGISVSDDWKNFETFYHQFGKFKTGNLTIDRINNDGNYELNNCRWATSSEQQNNKSTTTLIEFEGKTYSLKKFFILKNIKPGSAYYWLKKGFSVDWICERFNSKNQLTISSRNRLTSP